MIPRFYMRMMDRSCVNTGNAKQHVCNQRKRPFNRADKLPIMPILSATFYIQRYLARGKSFKKHHKLSLFHGQQRSMVLYNSEDYKKHRCRGSK